VQNQKTKQFLNIKNKYLQVSLKCLIAAVKCFTAAAKYKPNERCCQGLAAKLPLRLVFFSSSFLTVTQECQKETLSVFLLFFYCLSLAFFLSFFSYPLSRSLFFSYFSAPFFCYFSALFLPPPC
jgi:hypothetical protein